MSAPPTARLADPAAPVWANLVGQRSVAQTLDRAARGHGMSHAWLFTGPPGSGRSNAAMAFAAALLCERAGCGECQACSTALAGTHSDVSLTRTETAQIATDDMRELVLRSALAPVGHRWQVMVIEDADRLHERAANALLKAIEEPTRRTVWLLCAPTVEDVLPTIGSRCRKVVLSTPTESEVARHLVASAGVAEGVAWFAARASQGHIGRARALACDEGTRGRRREVVSIPKGLTSLGACMNAAANLVDIAKTETEAVVEASDTREKADIEATYGSDAKSRRSRTYQAALRDLAHSQKQRARRRTLDVIDRCLGDILTIYRDAITLQTGSRVALVNEEMRADVEELARRSTPEQNLRRIDAVFTAREQMVEHTVPPLLALESMMVALRLP
ncbi:MAG: DNA polymerase III delta prime subunit [uncultured Nocardioidaceae bacterium]|uniref:DNA polymerase III delta prime subunit n=1 Tax=uncultured Nocardioidaceae bacterium TaxID=253824 RepID=A0A6J4LN89_9ACTN|nr:MAG: DNA polymerase III delta prime subunit [uncultured Nocardioidaceae bacterium]